PAPIRQWLAGLKTVIDLQDYKEPWNVLRQEFRNLSGTEQASDFIASCLEKVNSDPALLKEVEQQQVYRLCHWQETDRQINYRRFFTVNGLICLNIQDPHVFDSYHQLTRELLQKGVFQGLRIDHIDGLYEPAAYLNRLRNMAGEEVPVVVEKILEPGESLPSDWPVQGNTGYDFLSLVNNLLTNSRSERAFTKFYRKLVADSRTVMEQLHEKKAYILNTHMAGELNNLYRMLRQLNLIDKRAFSYVRGEDLKDALGEFLVRCPVYRFYGESFPLQGEEAEAVHYILDEVRRTNGELRRAVDLLEQLLLYLPASAGEEDCARIAGFYRRCMQFTGPLMAKGMEDTLMYTYHRFIGHNEVGDSPEAFGISTDEFHRAMAERQQRWPFSLNATATHDTKRGEDVRARLNVLTDLDAAWIEAVNEWTKLNAPLREENGPDANDEYFVYQTIAGTFPMPGEHMEDFPDRLKAYLQKALREAKTNTNWTSPNEAYESSVINFALSLLNEEKPFRQSFDPLIREVSEHGIINSLSQVMLKFTCPGIPDVYQGCELWDLSLVDPDNRRPVDYEKRQQWLEELEGGPDPAQLWEHRHNGKIKLWLVNILASLRQQYPQLFTAGEYIPLQVEGEYGRHVMAFARSYRQQVLVVAIPLHTAILSREQAAALEKIDWKDTFIHLPEGTAAGWNHALSGMAVNGHTLKVSEIFSSLPLALLKGQRLTTERGAGILMHLSSLPSAFGIGDMGPEARAFADFLSRSRQKYWQLLPINPTEEGQGHSPYSATSSRAGNILFISPELLQKEGWLDAETVDASRLRQEGIVNYAEAARLRSILFEAAWQAFKAGKGTKPDGAFEAYKQKEGEWLDDFALYSLLKEEHGGMPWYQWPDPFKFREEQALRKLQAENEAVIEKIKWLQYIFDRQWNLLKMHCNNQGIRLIGDLPFYVSYDSADVWSHRRLFALDESGAPIGMAGVPPDAFSADGQLWGMPVYNWQAMEEEQYAWWIARLKKNCDQFDLVRLDHFRAFAAYWEVPAGESTARNGQWKQGPGEAFFQAIEKALGELPFIAEDLGEIDEPVYRLRDAFRLPGMKVLQFAFGPDMPSSVHTPHNFEKNFVVYTGTHDNNTTRGWFTRDADVRSRLALEQYVGRPLSSAEVSLVLARMAYGSVAAMAILPVQDLLNLDERARMNTPASASNNWAWRLYPMQLDGTAEENLKKWTRLYNRE
ncbi:MAG TPA: malto-oligosyltrehalose synthase, partial [Flavisolibacter sp.]|nr:malto-oligosyltrehalose synthase [Flavisolibacter sp.]